MYIVTYWDIEKRVHCYKREETMEDAIRCMKYIADDYCYKDVKVYELGRQVR